MDMTSMWLNNDSPVKEQLILIQREDGSLLASYAEVTDLAGDIPGFTVISELPDATLKEALVHGATQNQCPLEFAAYLKKVSEMLKEVSEELEEGSIVS